MWPLKSRTAESKPDPEHPFAEAGECWRYKPGRACRCPFWQSIHHLKPAQDGGGIELVQGCMGQVFPMIVGWAINSAGQADATAEAVRQDIQGGFASLVQAVAVTAADPRRFAGPSSAEPAKLAAGD